MMLSPHTPLAPDLLIRFLELCLAVPRAGVADSGLIGNCPQLAYLRGGAASGPRARRPRVEAEVIE